MSLKLLIQLYRMQNSVLKSLADTWKRSALETRLFLTRLSLGKEKGTLSCFLSQITEFGCRTLFWSDSKFKLLSDSIKASLPKPSIPFDKHVCCPINRTRFLSTENMNETLLKRSNAQSKYISATLAISTLKIPSQSTVMANKSKHQTVAYCCSMIISSFGRLQRQPSKPYSSWHCQLSKFGAQSAHLPDC